MSKYKFGLFAVTAFLAACNPIGLDDINATADPGQIGGEVAPSSGDLAIVVAVIDGDTIDVNIGGSVYRVRYIGINTPEVDELCSAEAAIANAALVEGQAVKLVKDTSEVDPYNRLLRYVYVGETFVNAELVRQGWAEAVEYPPDLANMGFFNDLEDAARLQNLGCWPTGVFTHE
ncbi:MAG: thermonuclease family protein [Anaerolineae bacterium]|nr:thermonuclease family protein [Anaerolineae bacterium]